MAGLLLQGARFAPLIFLTPVFGGRNAPAPVRIGLALALGVLTGGWPERHGDLVLKDFCAEIFTGFIFALPIVFVCGGIDIAGRAFDQACGTNSVEVLFPNGEERSSPAGILAGMTMTVLCFQAGVHMLAIGCIADSVDSIPRGVWPAFGPGAMRALVAQFAGAVAGGFALGMPFLGLAAGVDLGLSWAARLFPGAGQALQSMQVKNTLALLLVALGWDEMGDGIWWWAERIPALMENLIAAAR
jgi:flagellar biosynthesis protein FliR